MGPFTWDSNYQHENIASLSCFIQRKYNKWGKFHNSTIKFSNNVAKYGSSIYASFDACIEYSYCEVNESLTKLGCIAEIDGLETSDMSTRLNNFNYNNLSDDNNNMLIPGKPFKIPVIAKDDLGNHINVIYDAALKNNESSITLDGNVSTLSYVSNQSVLLGPEEQFTDHWRFAASQ